jgi:cation diffusion facilitator family transporter
MRPLVPHIPRPEAAAAIISLSVGITLLIIKFAAYFITESTAIYSDAVESIANVVASAVAFYALVVAHRPADTGHPWGHGKVEFMSASFEGGLILLAAMLIVLRAADAMWTGEVLRERALNSGLLLVVLASVVNALLAEVAGARPVAAGTRTTRLRGRSRSGSGLNVRDSPVASVCRHAKWGDLAGYRTADGTARPDL